MKRLLALLFLLSCGPAWAEDLPEPPTPPSRIPEAEAAPVPDREISAGIASAADTASVELRDFQSPASQPGLGFTPGSRFRTPQERKPVQTPGVSISVPLQ